MDSQQKAARFSDIKLYSVCHTLFAENLETTPVVHCPLFYSPNVLYRFVLKTFRNIVNFPVGGGKTLGVISI